MPQYIILQLFPGQKGWYPHNSFPNDYLTMKTKMKELRKQNAGIKYKLMKTTY